jgi:phosphopantothenoylcysteine decarboxylase/phosphopantothenate--cysteine ligase
VNIIIGITGSIAAFKSLELIRMLRKDGASVRVILTEAARQFVTPLSCQTLSGNEVYCEQFASKREIEHIALAEWGDVFAIAPATANIIGKAANGIADDLVSTALLPFQKPVLFVPAMNSGMWSNKIVQKNVDGLRRFGYHVLDPGFGLLASGKTGQGRFPAVAMIARKIKSLAEDHKEDLSGMKFLVSGGRTEEDIDPVRVITNRSSGRMARELLYAIVCRGGMAKGVIGEVTVDLPADLDITRARTSVEMLQELKDRVAWCDVLVMAAAVGDYRPVEKNVKKLHDRTLSVSFEKNHDLLKTLTSDGQAPFIVGFSLEDDDTEQRGKAKMVSKNCDMIVLNNSSAIGQDESAAALLKKDGSLIRLDTLTKWQLANRIIDACLEEHKAGH